MTGNQITQIIDQQIYMVRWQLLQGSGQIFQHNRSEDGIGKTKPEGQDTKCRQKAPQGGQHPIVSRPGMKPGRAGCHAGHP